MTFTNARQSIGAGRHRETVVRATHQARIAHLEKQVRETFAANEQLRALIAQEEASLR